MNIGFPVPLVPITPSTRFFLSRPFKASIILRRRLGQPYLDSRGDFTRLYIFLDSRQVTPSLAIARPSPSMKILANKDNPYWKKIFSNISRALNLMLMSYAVATSRPRWQIGCHSHEIVRTSEKHTTCYK